jgi:N-dimethylarginine dimethylaminohydrolase
MRHVDTTLQANTAVGARRYRGVIIRAVGGALAGLAVGLAVLALLPKSGAPAGEGRCVAQSDASGAFKAIVMHYSPKKWDKVSDCYRSFLTQIHPDVIVYVPCASRADFDEFMGYVKEWGVASPDRFRPVIMDKVISTWSRDRYTLAITEGGESVLMIPPKTEAAFEERFNDWFVPLKISECAPHCTVRQLDMFFDGGNLINSDEYLFVDYNLVAKNVGTKFAGVDALLDYLKKQFNKEVILLGGQNGDVPEHHIGMYLTPLSGKTVLVADARLGKKIVEENGLNAGTPDFGEEIAARFDYAAEELKRRGFNVLRIPVVPMEGGGAYLTYNNLMLETRDGKTIVYMPTYNLPALDNAAREIIASQGIDVRTVDASKVYTMNGSLRCLVNVLSRGK